MPLRIITIRAEDRLVKAIVRAAKTEGRSVASMIRRILEDWRAAKAPEPTERNT